MCEQEKDLRYYFCISNNEHRMLSDHDIVLKVEKDTMGQKKTSQWIFLNFIYIVLWDVPNKI
jgi:hypothetical protein